jgi:hypothetical protein
MTAFHSKKTKIMTLEELKKDPMKQIERVAKSKDINALIKAYEEQRNEQRKRYKKTKVAKGIWI